MIQKQPPIKEAVLFIVGACGYNYAITITEGAAL